MKILMATDGSPCSDAALKEVCSRAWPPGTQVKVIEVVHVQFPCFLPPVLVEEAICDRLLADQMKLASENVARAARLIQDRVPGLHVSTDVVEGFPKKAIVEEAERWGADLIVVGSHGYGPAGRFVLGSVSHAVAMHAPCSVEIVRKPHPVDAGTGRAQEGALVQR